MTRAAFLVLTAAALAQPPKTRIDNVTETLHGVTITDPYRWLEDQNSPETRAWIDAQVKYTESLLSKAPGRDRIRQRLEQLMKVEVINPPQVRGGRYFFTRRLATQNQAVLYVRKGASGKDEVLVDPNAMSADQTVSAQFAGLSRDGKLAAYSVRQGGEDEVEIRIRDVDAGSDLPDRLPRARVFGVSFKPDRSGFYYSRFTPQGSRIYYHALGSDVAADPEIFGKGHGPEKNIGAALSRDGRYLTFTVSHGSAARKTEIYYQDLANKGPLTTLVNDIDARFYGRIEDGRMYVQTNWNAPNDRILAVDMSHPARENWREVVPERPYVLQGFSLTGGRLFVEYLENVQNRVEMLDTSGKRVRELKFPALGNGSNVFGEWERDEAFYTFSSFAQPLTIYRYSVSTGKQEVWARAKVPVDSGAVEVKQVWYESKDKTRVPMFVAHKKGLKLDGSAPALLTGYGGFNLSQLPFFSARSAYWIEQGGVFALPNLRGGSEFGEKWHQAGMLANKQNVFDDFIAAAEFLIAKGYTRSSRLAIAGGSNGGLLVGAALTQRPDLFQAVQCGAPLLDMVRYHRFKVARWWVPEYGSSEDPQQFEFIQRYSPYHRVRPGTKYPAVMFTTGDSDTRVDPLHARKMAALMQAATASDRPILLHYDTKAGHSGGLPVTKQIEDLADQMAFFFWQLGIADRGT